MTTYSAEVAFGNGEPRRILKVRSRLVLAPMLSAATRDAGQYQQGYPAVKSTEGERAHTMSLPSTSLMIPTSASVSESSCTVLHVARPDIGTTDKSQMKSQIDSLTVSQIPERRGDRRGQDDRWGGGRASPRRSKKTRATAESP